MVFLCHFLSGNALVSLIDCLILLLLRQFPFESSNHMFPMRRSVSLFANSMMVGLSLVPPDWRCMPKYFSKGSWQIRLLKKHVTPGILKTKVYSSKNEETTHKTIEKIKNQNYTTNLLKLSHAVTLWIKAQGCILLLKTQSESPHWFPTC